MSSSVPPATLSPPLGFTSVQSGMAFIARLPLADPAAAQQQLLQFLDALLADPPGADGLFTLLEQARVPMSFVGAEMARRFHNKPLILGDVEEAIFQQVVMVWRRMEKAYALCARLDAGEVPEDERLGRTAAILHRCIYYTGMNLLEHFRARRELPPGLWLDLHGYYETAEEWNVATVPVRDVLELEVQSSHCAAAYATLLLVDMANPYSRSVRDLGLIRRWAGLWGPLVSVHPPAPDLDAPAYVVHLMKDVGMHPPAPGEAAEAMVRRLDTARLAVHMGQVMHQLRDRIPPSQLGLGEETAGHVLNLLGQLARPWNLSTSPRKFRRFPTSGTARVCVGFAAMHFAVTGEEFQQPDVAQAYSRRDFDTLYTFRDQAGPGQKLVIREKADFPFDEWKVLNHSANGFRVIRSPVGQKMSHGQLMAICPHDGDRFLLARVSWLVQDREGGLMAGVAVLPGVPEGVAVRIAETGRPEKFTQAFRLPAIPPVGEPASLVLPSGMYQPSRPLDVWSASGQWRVLMKGVLERGNDYERIGFELA